MRSWRACLATLMILTMTVLSATVQAADWLSEFFPELTQWARHWKSRLWSRYCRTVRR